MNYMDILKHLNASDEINARHWLMLRTPDERNTVDFVREYFGGDFVAGYLHPGRDYIAFYDYFPQGVADAVVTDSEGQYMRIYEIDH